MSSFILTRYAHCLYKTFLAGSGRVTFNNQRSYLKAVCAAFVEIKTPKFTKKVRYALCLFLI